MTNLWYNNPEELLTNLDQFLPTKNLNRIQKINSLARFSIYYILLISIFKYDNKYISVGIIIMLISIFLGTTEGFTSTDNVLPQDCQKPTKDNPFMNYTVNDLMTNPNRLRACDYESVKDEMRKEFRQTVYSDTSDIWGKFITDRNYYTMPNTELVNDQTGFATWCFGNSGECKTYGTNCLKVRDPTYHRGRMTTIDDNGTI